MKTENAIVTRNVSDTTGMKVKSNIKAGPGGGGIWLNHNQTVVKQGLRVKSNVKVGGPLLQHNQTVVRDVK